MFKFIKFRPFYTVHPCPLFPLDTCYYNQRKLTDHKSPKSPEFTVGISAVLTIQYNQDGLEDWPELREDIPPADSVIQLAHVIVYAKPMLSLQAFAPPPFCGKIKL